MTTHFVMMGVCGCGKTTAALSLQKYLDQCPYAEGDDFHTQANRDKMGAGIPLTDEDRYPWLGNLRDWMTEQAKTGRNIPSLLVPHSSITIAIFCVVRKGRWLLSI